MLEIKIDDKEMRDLLNKLQDKFEDTTPIMMEIAAKMNQAVEDNFEQEGRPSWDDLSNVTKKKRARRGYLGKILHETGSLQDSITPFYDKDTAGVGTNKIYAKVMQFGAKKGAFGKDKHGRSIPWGNIPARPFMQITEEDKNEIIEIIKKFLE